MSIQADMANSSEFITLWRNGCSVRDIAKRYGCSACTVKKAARQLRITHPNANELGFLATAPSYSEELQSMESLDLAPSVARRAEQIKLDCFVAMQEGKPSPYRRAGGHR